MRRAMRALLDGRLEEAERLARGALEIGGLRQNEYVPYLFEHALLVTIRWMQGRLGELREAIRFHGERFSSLARWRNALVAVELADEQAARAEVERHAQRDFAGLPGTGSGSCTCAALPRHVSSSATSVGRRGSTSCWLRMPTATRSR